MQFRDLKVQYKYLKNEIDASIQNVMDQGVFIEGQIVRDFEIELAKYVGVKHCISCANGTDALELALITWNIGKNDAVFVPDFTFFSSGEVVSTVGATPIFVDVDEYTCNMNPLSLEKMIKKVIEKGELKPKVIIAVDLFGQPADYIEIRKIASKYGLLILEDGAQGFGGKINEQRACSFGDISTTSFFPAKPLGCYGDGGAIFTDNDEWATLIRSYKVHGKGESKYDNIRIGMNSRLDTIQAAILSVKFPIFINEELNNMQKIASLYTEKLESFVIVPLIKEGFYSSWAQYTIQLESEEQRNSLQKYLNKIHIPTMIYYQKPMHEQKAFNDEKFDDSDYCITNKLCNKVLSLPFHPYMSEKEVDFITNSIKEYL